MRLEDFPVFPSVLLLQYQGEIRTVKKQTDTTHLQYRHSRVSGEQNPGAKGGSTSYRPDQSGRSACGCQGGKEWGGTNWEIGVDVHTLLNIKWITNEDLLYSTRSSTQSSVMACEGKESKTEWVYA